MCRRATNPEFLQWLKLGDLTTQTEVIRRVRDENVVNFGHAGGPIADALVVAAQAHSVQLQSSLPSSVEAA